MKGSRPAPFAHVIGDPVVQSRSPAIHGFWLEKLGIAGTYDARTVGLPDLAGYLEQVCDKPGWAGCNVTMPLKQAALELCDELDPAASRIGAVNTIVSRRAGGITGLNTDAAGFLEPLLPQLGSQHFYRMARIMGTGGAARAICTALADHGFTLVVAGRDPDKARTLLDACAPGGDHHAVPLDYFAQPTDFPFDDRAGCLDLVVNATPLGMEGNAPLAFDWSHAPPGAIAYDIVTSPVHTPFLAAARRAGHRTIGGLTMLVGQAAIAFEAFFGQPPPREHDGELFERLAR